MGTVWKQSLAENLKRVTESVKADSNHPVNSKLRKNIMVSCGENMED